MPGGKPLTFCNVEDTGALQLYVNGAVPPTIFAVILPFDAPKQLTFDTFDIIAVPLVEALIVTTPVCVQFLLSVTKTV